MNLNPDLTPEVHYAIMYLACKIPQITKSWILFTCLCRKLQPNMITKKKKKTSETKDKKHVFGLKDDDQKKKKKGHSLFSEVECCRNKGLAFSHGFFTFRIVVSIVISCIN